MSDKFRNTGRTTRLIVAQVKQALRKQGETICIHDHIGDGVQEERDRDVARRVSQHLKFLGVEHDLNENRILVHSIKKRVSHAH